jgi:hypothetical protein
MKEGYILGDQTKVYFITATIVDWADMLKPICLLPITGIKRL